MKDNITNEIYGNIGVIHINSQKITNKDINKIRECMDYILFHDNTKCIIFTSDNDDFSYGLDLKSDDYKKNVDTLIDNGQKLITQIMKLEHIITIAYISGACVGGGFELALACDTIWCDDTSYFGFPEFGNNLLPAWRGVSNAMTNLSKSVISNMLLLNERLSCEDAKMYGLVSEVNESSNTTFLHDKIKHLNEYLSNIDHHTIIRNKALIKESDMNTLKELDLHAFLLYHDFMSLYHRKSDTSINKLF